MASCARCLAYLVDSLIALYQWTFALWLGGRCRFYPSCSAYARQALASQPLSVACSLLLRRLLRCRPGYPPGIDLVPPSRNGHL